MRIYKVGMCVHARQPGSFSSEPTESEIANCDQHKLHHNTRRNDILQLRAELKLIREVYRGFYIRWDFRFNTNRVAELRIFSRRLVPAI